MRGAVWLALVAVGLCAGCERPTVPNASAMPRAAAGCAACHGPLGISAIDVYPNLAGQKETYLLNQLRAYKSGERSNPMMQSIVIAMDDDTLKSLAAYFASLPPCVSEKP